MAETTSTSKNARPNSIEDALKILDEALAGQAGDLRSLVTDEYQNLQSAISQAGDKAGINTADIGNSIRNFGTQAMTHITDLSSTYLNQEAIGDVIASGKELATEIDNRVKSNPWPVIGGVAVGTLALGILLGRSATEKSV